MKVYLIIEVDSYNFVYPTSKCFASKEKAEEYCCENNTDTYAYLQQCADEHESPGNYVLLKVLEIEVLEE